MSAEDTAERAVSVPFFRAAHLALKAALVITPALAPTAPDNIRLASLFDAEVVSFERKQFVNLSHEPNKAMNLNAYISLLGRSFQTRRQAHTNLIEEVSPGLADLHIPRADYIITLDADSILLPDYALRLVEVIEETASCRCSDSLHRRS